MNKHLLTPDVEATPDLGEPMSFITVTYRNMGEGLLT